MTPLARRASLAGALCMGLFMAVAVDTAHRLAKAALRAPPGSDVRWILVRERLSAGLRSRLPDGWRELLETRHEALSAK